MEALEAVFVEIADAVVAVREDEQLLVDTSKPLFDFRFERTVIARAVVHVHQETLHLVERGERLSAIVQTLEDGRRLRVSLDLNDVDHAVVAQPL